MSRPTPIVTDMDSDGLAGRHDLSPGTRERGRERDRERGEGEHDHTKVCILVSLNFLGIFRRMGRSIEIHALDLSTVQGHIAYSIAVEDCQYAYSNMDVLCKCICSLHVQSLKGGDGKFPLLALCRKNP